MPPVLPPPPDNSVRSNSRKVPRNNNENASENEVSAIATRGSPPAPLSSIPTKKRRPRRRRLDKRAANRKEGHSSAAPLTQDASWANQCAAVPAGATQPLPETSDPTSARQTAVYPPSRIVGDSPANENSPFQISLESSRIPGLYKPAVPDQQQDTHARTFRIRHLLSPLLDAKGWNCVPIAAACSTPRYAHHRGRRPSRASHLPASGPATHCSGYWKPCPVPEASCSQKTRF